MSLAKDLYFLLRGLLWSSRATFPAMSHGRGKRLCPSLWIFKRFECHAAMHFSKLNLQRKTKSYMETFDPGCCVSNKGFYYVSQAGAGSTVVGEELRITLWQSGRESCFWRWKKFTGLNFSFHLPGFHLFPRYCSSSHKGFLLAIVGGHLGLQLLWRVSWCHVWVVVLQMGDILGCNEWLRAISLEKPNAIYAIWGLCWPNFGSRRPSQGCSAVYLLFAVWLSMHASVASHSYLAAG